MAPMPAADNVAGRQPSALATHVFSFALLAAVVFAASLVGGISRPLGLLAAFWPANALVAGILVRDRRLRRRAAIAGATFGYMAGALAVGDPLLLAFELTAANLAGCITFILICGRRDRPELALDRSADVVWMLAGATVAAAAASVIGAFAVGGLVGGGYDGNPTIWFASELVNYVALLPVILTLPRPITWRNPWAFRFPEPAFTAPLVGLFLAVCLSLAVPHPVSVAFPVPALIWCALVLPISVNAVLVMLYSVLAMVGIKLGLFDLGLGRALDEESIAAVHLGIALVACGPLLVASVSAERRRQMEQLRRLAHHDALTDALTRAAFAELGEKLLETLGRHGTSGAVLVVDADHFKLINDEFGHLSGDRVLVAVAAAIRAAIRQGDLFGRIGGEEFALVLPGVTEREARAVAERLRRAVANLEVVLENGDVQRITVSVGVAVSDDSALDLTEMVSLADRAMYDAKRAGRNRVEVRNASDANVAGQDQDGRD